MGRYWRIKKFDKYPLIWSPEMGWLRGKVLYCSNDYADFTKEKWFNGVDYNARLGFAHVEKDNNDIINYVAENYDNFRMYNSLTKLRNYSFNFVFGDVFEEVYRVDYIKCWAEWSTTGYIKLPRSIDVKVDVDGYGMTIIKHFYKRKTMRLSDYKDAFAQAGEKTPYSLDLRVFGWDVDFPFEIADYRNVESSEERYYKSYPLKDIIKAEELRKPPTKLILKKVGVDDFLNKLNNVFMYKENLSIKREFERSEKIFLKKG